MLGLLGSLFGLIPGLENFASTLLTAHFNAQVSMYQARMGVTRDVAIAAISAQSNALGALAATPLGQVIYFMFSFPCAVYTGKVIFWDKVLGWGSTDVITGPVGTVYMMIVGFWFVGVLRQVVLK